MRTEGDACGPGNDEWPTSRHDEFNSGAYGTDARPIGTPRDLSVAAREDGGADLAMRVPGDDWLCGRASSYEVLVSDDPIEHPADGSAVSQGDVSVDSGGPLTAGISPNDAQGQYAAILFRDDSGNWGHLASVPLPAAGPDCSAGFDGTEGADRLFGSDLGERIRGRGGNDRISAGLGNDCVAGGGGKDRVKGQAGADRLKGQAGKDRLSGGNGDDLLRGAAGNDSLRGGSGDDRIQGKTGTDVISGAAGRDLLRGGEKPDKVNGGAGDDRIDVVGGGLDRVTCGGGTDLVRAGRSDRIAKSCERVKLG